MTLTDKIFAKRIAYIPVSLQLKAPAPITIILPLGFFGLSSIQQVTIFTTLYYPTAWNKFEIRIYVPLGFVLVVFLLILLFFALVVVLFFLVFFVVVST